MDIYDYMVLGILGGTLCLLASDRVRHDIVGLLIIVCLLFSGIFQNHAKTQEKDYDPIREVLSSFSEPVLIAVAAFFVISHGILRTGALAFVAERIALISKGDTTRMMLTSMTVVFLLSAFTNNTPVVAIFVPIVLRIANDCSVLPSKLLMPISYASLFGGSCTLIGTSTNLLVHGEMKKIGLDGLSMFTLAPLGLVLSLAGFLYMSTIGRRLLPERQTVTTILGKNRRPEYFTEIEIKEGSSFEGKTLGDCLKSYDDLNVLEVMRREETLWNPDATTPLKAGDVLLIKGNADSILNIESSGQVEALPDLLEGKIRFDSRNMILAELVLTPDSPMLGKTINESNFQKESGVRVIAVLRQGRHIRERVSQLKLQHGDILLVFGESETLDRFDGREDVLLMDGVHETVEFKKQAPLALVVLAVVITLITLDLVSAVSAALTGALAMVIGGCLSIRDAYKAINWQVLFLIAGTISLGEAMTITKTAETLIGAIREPLDSQGPLFGLGFLYIVTTSLTHVISNNAAAILMVPISAQMAAGFHCRPEPFIIAVAFAASASFSTPMSYQTNQIVYGPGGYTFRDYLRVGLPLNAIFFIITILVLPLIWPF